MRRAAAFVLACALSGCGVLRQLSEVGGPPAMTPTANPTRQPGWRPVTMPMPAARPVPRQEDSLWRPGSRAFFKDQRAARVGDLVTIVVTMNDSASLKNNTTATRSGSESLGVPNFFGLEALLTHVPMDPSKLVSSSSANGNTGTGQIQRNEQVTLRLAGEVTQVLPDGNLVVMASQEFRVGNELRALRVSGVIRPEDIASDNTISSDRMAEARIAYGGRGELSAVQAPRWGQQVLDAIAPF
ncbi:MAG: flagellar basal body L-ring protein FlgH [Rhodospirillales bacterium]|nr:flagellar basal body L-ring protein FlgH [Rhodospirillales bacterium]